MEGFERRLLLAFSSDTTDAALAVGIGCSCGCQGAASQQLTLDAMASAPRLADTQVVRLQRKAGVEGFWRPMASLPKERARAIQVVHANAMAPFKINLQGLRRTLQAAPMEFTAAAAENPLTLSLPNPDGGFSRFAVWESPLLSGTTAARFSNIRTYAGQGLDDPTQVLRFDVSPQGLRATILGGSGTYYIDPVFHRSTDAFVAYYRQDAWMNPLNAGFVCETAPGVPVEDDPMTPEPGPGGDDGEPAFSSAFGEAGRSGTQLRTYRLAVATTGEYTAFHGGTVAGGLAAVVTAVNRMNAIYERDFAIRMTLVENNNLLIYTNAATDPFTSPGSALTTAQQNHNNTVAVIGSDNFDVGHVFHRGSNNGVAGGIGVVGNPGFKGQGYSSATTPVNDPFVIDYVAHEIGHQFGGRHSFSNCGGGAGDSAGIAVEPGSGSTIMAYAGICGAGFDLQSNSDAMFHSISFDQVISFVDNSIPGVGTRTSTGNIAPAISALANRTIPANTPYFLTADAVDANGDALTYSWEQRNGASGTPVNTTTSTTGPMVRALLPSTSPTRTIPNQTDLLNNTTTLIGERLSAVTRSLNFTVMVRDNRAGGGGVNTANMVVSVVNTGAAFAVTSPNTNVSWALGSTQTVTWNVAGTTGNGINTANVRILLSTNGGNSFPHVLLESTPNNGSAQVTLPTSLPATGAARIRVEAVGNIFFDISNVNFTLLPPAPAAPVLTAAADTGISDSDGITRFNNASAATRLTFTVSNVVSGNTVRLFRDGVEVASAVAFGNTATLVTSGSAAFPDGVSSFTAIQQSGSLVSPTSSATAVTIDTIAPVASYGIDPTARNTPLNSLPISFTENVFNLTPSSFILVRDGVTQPTSGLTLTGSGSSFTLEDLAPLTAPTGNYSLNLFSLASDAAGNLATGLTTFSNNVVNLPADAPPGGNRVVLRPDAQDPALMRLFVNTNATEPTFSWTFQPGQELRIVGTNGLDTVRYEGTDAPVHAAVRIIPGSGPAEGDLLEVATGTYRSTVAPAAPMRLSVFSNARVELDTAHTLRDTAIAEGGTLALNAPLDIDGTLTVASDAAPLGQRNYTGFVDLRDTSLIVRNGDLALLRDMTRHWWTASAGLPGTTGLGSSLAFYSPDGAFRTVGVLSNLGFPGSSSLSSFAGKTVSPTDVLLRYTFLGDTDLSGTLDAADLSRLLQGFNGTASALPGGGSGWNFGDIDYDGQTTFFDLGRVLAALRV